MSTDKRQKVFDHLEALAKALRDASNAGELDRYDLENIKGRVYGIYQGVDEDLYAYQMEHGRHA